MSPLWFSIFIVKFILSVKDVDENGYLVYCPCMGRFGNQAEHFLGVLAFAKALNRTLILPPWVEYRTGETKSVQVPFDRYFDVDSLRKFHRVIIMEIFMRELAPVVWKPENRTVFCYGPRGKSDNSCNAKEGNPFRSFWDTFHINFVNSEFYKPLNYDVHHRNMVDKWNEMYPAHKWKVLAFTGAPASFPIQDENRKLHKYLKWNEKMLRQAQNYIAKSFPRTSFIGIHLRNGPDWNRACLHVGQSQNLFSSAQCLGYMNEHGSLTMEICDPSQKTIIKQLKRAVESFNGSSPIRASFVASDFDYMYDILNANMKPMNVNIYRLDVPDPHMDLMILSMSNHFIGNCVSSFTAFVKRERDTFNFPSEFWGMVPHERIFDHDEL